MNLRSTYHTLVLPAASLSARYLSLGYYERDDLAVVVDHLRESYGVTCIGPGHLEWPWHGQHGVGYRS